MVEERIWELLTLKLSGEASSLELDELNHLLMQHPECVSKAETIKKIWANKRSLDKLNDRSFNKHLQRLSTHLSEPILLYEGNTTDAPAPPEPVLMQRSVVKKIWAWSSIAAAACIVLIFLLAKQQPVKSIPPKDISAKNTVSTQPGLKSRVILPDGSTIMLNTGSFLTYDDAFGSNGIREVQLSGEAYFDVSKDPKRPFIIHTNSIDIKVLGTAFNVRSYPNENTTETSLVHGSVEVSVHNNPDRRIILKPSEKLIVNNSIIRNEPVKADSGKPKREEAMMTLSKMHFDRTLSSSIETRWTQERLIFEETPFMSAITDLERMYNVKFVVKKEKLKRETITGDFENKSLDIVMEALKLSSRFNYETTDGVVTIW